MRRSLFAVVWQQGEVTHLVEVGVWIFGMILLEESKSCSFHQEYIFCTNGAGCKKSPRWAAPQRASDRCPT